MPLRPSTIAGVIWLIVGSLSALSASAADRPNILLIVADDLGWADVGWHGGKFQTPVMDGLVRAGVELDRHYVQPVCSPTRTALLTGRWTGRFGPHVLKPTNLRAFPLDTVTLASALKEAGYSTYLAGKWHLGSRPEWGPQHYGFDESCGSLAGAVDPWTHGYREGPYEKTWHRNGKILEEEGNATELVAKQVVRWIRDKHAPWFIYVPFHAVHIPIDAPSEFRDKYKDAKFHDNAEKNESLQRFGAFVTQLDSKIGEFVKALDETGQRENTLIVFTSDNGGKLDGVNDYVSNVPPTPALSSNAPLRGEKAQLFEGGVRVCAFANWPGHLQPSKVTIPVAHADWMPTLTKLAGWKSTKDLQWDGQDMWPVISSQVKQIEPRSIYLPLPNQWAVIRDGWKLIARKNGNDSLFNLEADPSEKHNLASSEPQRLAEFHAELKRLRAGDLDTLPADLEGVPTGL
jgi:arylsulfatase A-like enzyme